MQRSVSAFAGFATAAALGLGGAWSYPAVAGGQNLVPAVTPWTMNRSRVGATDLEAT